MQGGLQEAGIKSGGDDAFLERGIIPARPAEWACVNLASTGKNLRRGPQMGRAEARNETHMGYFGDDIRQLANLEFILQ